MNFLCMFLLVTFLCLPACSPVYAESAENEARALAARQGLVGVIDPSGREILPTAFEQAVILSDVRAAGGSRSRSRACTVCMMPTDRS